MFYPRTARQERFVAVADDLVPSFAQRASAHDREGTFPHENFADIRYVGLAKLVIPEEFGGWGANLAETLMTMEALAVGDGSTALSLTMHMQTMGNAAETRAWPEALFEQICRDAVEKGALINALATEPELGSPSRGGKPKSVAEPIFGNGAHPSAWRISGHKNYATMSPTLDYLVVPATLQDGSEEVARFVVPQSAGIEIIETWDGLGMRSTGSHDVVLHSVEVPDAFMIARSGSAKPEQQGLINAWFMLVISAVYVGVAEAALRTAAGYAQERVPTALGRPIATLEGIQRHLGQAEMLLHDARVQLYHNAMLWDQQAQHRRNLAPSVGAAKVRATNNAIEAVDHCMRVAGGVGMTRSLPLERYYRDVRGGLTHPVNDDQAYVMAGQGVLREREAAREAVTDEG